MKHVYMADAPSAFFKAYGSPYSSSARTSLYRQVRIARLCHPSIDKPPKSFVCVFSVSLCRRMTPKDTSAFSSFLILLGISPKKKT